MQNTKGSVKMKTPAFKKVLTGLAVFCLILLTSACLDIFGFRSNIQVIPRGKGIRAPGLKAGAYKDFSEEPKITRISWHKQAKEYEIEFTGSDPSRFQLLKLRRKYYLLQTKEENHFSYVVIKVHRGIVDFLNIKEDHEEKLERLLKRHGLAVEEGDHVIGSRDGLVLFFKDLVRKKYLHSGERLRYIGKKQPGKE
jgi:hypothetical protein